MDCKQIAEHDVLDRYLLEQLTERDREAFELHYFECGSCFAQLQTLMAVQNELLHSQRSVAKVKGTFLKRILVPAFTIAMFLLVIGTWYSARRRHTGGPVASQAPTTNPTPSSSPNSPSLEQLAKVEPPPYFAVALRSPEDDAHQEFRAAMQFYSQGEYSKAIPGLREAVKSDQQAVSYKFYLGACYLLSGQMDSAVSVFRKTIAMGDPTYSEQAHFYLAKAYLKKQDMTGAERELQASIGFHASKESEANELLRQLRK